MGQSNRRTVHLVRPYVVPPNQTHADSRPADRWARSIRHAACTLRARPGFSAAILLTLALGIGVTTAIFSVVNGVLLCPLAFVEEPRLPTICETYPGASNDWCSISPPNVADIADRSARSRRWGSRVRGRRTCPPPPVRRG